MYAWAKYYRRRASSAMNSRRFIRSPRRRWPWAQAACGRRQSAKQPTIGYLGSSTALTQSQWTAAFSKRLRELGWIEGRNVAIDYR
jgi:hypothetical protein